VTGVTEDSFDDIYIPAIMPKIPNRASFQKSHQAYADKKPMNISIDGTLILPKLDTSKIVSSRYEE